MLMRISLIMRSCMLNDEPNSVLHELTCVTLQLCVVIIFAYDYEMCLK